MAQKTTHNTNVSVTVSLAANPQQEAGFGVVLLLVPLATNSLNGDRVVEYASYDEAYTAQGSGYISASTLAAARTVFLQSPKPASLKVGYVDRTLVKASKDFGTVGTGAFDTELQAHTGGQDGNDITVQLVGDSGAGVTIDVTDSTVVIHYQPTVSTVANVETAITALAGDDDIIDVKTAGTGATVLGSGAAFAATALTGGSGETFAEGLAACIEYDSDFYGVCSYSRTVADIVDLADYVETADKLMQYVFQSSDATIESASLSSGFDGIVDYERTTGVFHTSDSAWNDLAHLANRLSFDPDTISCPWHANPLAEVDDLSPVPTKAQRAYVIANNFNLGLPQGGEDFVMDPGVNISGRPNYEILTADWFAVRLRERINELVVDHSRRGEKIVVDASGQRKVLSVILGLLQQGVAAGHFASGQTSATAETITSTDLANRRMRFTIRAQDAVSGRLFTFDLYASRDPISQ